MIITTADGSHSFYSSQVDENYHSTNGAIGESKHIFIEGALKQSQKPFVNILEIGFGSGLNAFLTLLEAQKTGQQIHYSSIELYPVSVEEASLLNYAELLDGSQQSSFLQLHKSEWGRDIAINSLFTLHKINADFTVYNLTQNYDVIYFDAFSPEKQPEMWSENIFEQLYLHCNPQAVLTTYCAKGAVRRAMQKAGFVVERLPGPPGKREILRARKPV